MEELNAIAVRSGALLEGHVGSIEGCMQSLRTMVRTLPSQGRILEIGFNCGHSSYVMLAERPDVTITSIDIGHHAYTLEAKKYVDKLFPNRHTLLIGDSQSVMKTIHGQWDLFFIDGGHEYAVAKSDIDQCLRLAKPGDLLIVDDVVATPSLHAEYTIGPSRAWAEAVAAGRVCQLELAEFGHGRGMVLGSKV